MQALQHAPCIGQVAADLRARRPEHLHVNSYSKTKHLAMIVNAMLQMLAVRDLAAALHASILFKRVAPVITPCKPLQTLPAAAAVRPRRQAACWPRQCPTHQAPAGISQGSQTLLPADFKGWHQGWNQMPSIAAPPTMLNQVAKTTCAGMWCWQLVLVCMLACRFRSCMHAAAYAAGRHTLPPAAMSAPPTALGSGQ